MTDDKGTEIIAALDRLTEQYRRVADHHDWERKRMEELDTAKPVAPEPAQPSAWEKPAFVETPVEEEIFAGS